MSVLTQSSTSPIAKQKSIFAKSGYNLEFTDEFLNELVDKSYNSAVGTRALDSYVKQAVNQASFDLLSLLKSNTKDTKVLITNECLKDPGQYEVSKVFSPLVAVAATN